VLYIIKDKKKQKTEKDSNENEIDFYDIFLEAIKLGLFLKAF